MYCVVVERSFGRPSVITYPTHPIEVWWNHFTFYINFYITLPVILGASISIRLIYFIQIIVLCYHSISGRSDHVLISVVVAPIDVHPPELYSFFLLLGEHASYSHIPKASIHSPGIPYKKVVYGTVSFDSQVSAMILESKKSGHFRSILRIPFVKIVSYL